MAPVQPTPPNPKKASKKQRAKSSKPKWIYPRLLPVTASIIMGDDEEEITTLKHFTLGDVRSLHKARNLVSNHFSAELRELGFKTVSILSFRLHTLNYDPSSSSPSEGPKVEPFYNVKSQGFYAQWSQQVKQAGGHHGPAKMQIHISASRNVDDMLVSTLMPMDIVKMQKDDIKKLRARLDEAESRAEQAEKDLKENERIWDKVFEEGQARWAGQKDEDEVSVEDEPMEDEYDDGWRHYGTDEEGEMVE